MKFFVLLIYICLGFKCGNSISLKHFFTSTTPFSSADHELAFPICANCTSELNIHTSSDFYCHYEDELSVEEGVKEMRSSYAGCVPDQFAIARTVQRYCCFRSPGFGCSALIGRKFFNRKIYSCNTCKRFCSGAKQSYVDEPDGSNVASTHGSLVLLAVLVLRICRDVLNAL